MQKSETAKLQLSLLLLLLSCDLAKWMDFSILSRVTHLESSRQRNRTQQIASDFQSLGNTRTVQQPDFFTFAYQQELARVVAEQTLKRERKANCEKRQCEGVYVPYKALIETPSIASSEIVTLEKRQKTQLDILLEQRASVLNAERKKAKKGVVTTNLSATPFEVSQFESSRPVVDSRAKLNAQLTALQSSQCQASPLNELLRQRAAAFAAIQSSSDPDRKKNVAHKRTVQHVNKDLRGQRGKGALDQLLEQRRESAALRTNSYALSISSVNASEEPKQIASVSRPVVTPAPKEKRVCDIVRSKIRQYKERVVQSLKIKALYAASFCPTLSAYGNMKNVLERMLNSVSKGREKLFYGVPTIALPNVKQVRAAKRAINIGTSIPIYSVPPALLAKSSEGESLVETGLASLPNETCEHNPNNPESAQGPSTSSILNDEENVKYVGCVYDSHMGLSFALQHTVHLGEASPALEAAFPLNVDQMTCLHAVPTSSLSAVSQIDSEPGSYYAQMNHESKSFRVKVTVLRGVLWMDGYTPDGQSRLMVLLWLYDPLRVLIKNYAGISEIIPIAQLRGSESSLLDVFAFGSDLHLETLALQINRSLFSLQSHIFPLSEHEGIVHAFGIDIATHTLDGKASVKCLGLLGGHAQESQPNPCSYVPYKDHPTAIQDDGSPVILRRYEDVFYDYVRTQSWLDILPDMFERIRKRLATIAATPLLYTELFAELKQIEKLPFSHLVPNAWRQHKSPFDKQLLTNLVHDVSVVPCKVPASADDMQLVSLALLAFAKSALISKKDAVQLSRAQKSDVEHAFIKMNGEVATTPFIFLNDGVDPRPWPPLLGMPPALPHVAIRPLHSVWKVALAVVSEAMDHGAYIYVLDANGKQVPLLTSTHRALAKALLKKATIGAGKKDVTSADSPNTRKDVLSLLDLYSTIPFQTFFPHSWKCLIHLTRMVGYLYDLKCFDKLPTAYVCYPEIVFGVYSLAQVMVHEAMVTSHDRKANGYRHDLLLAELQISLTRTPLCIDGEELGEGALPFFKRAAQRGSKQLQVQLENVARDLELARQGAVKYLPQHKVQAKRLRGAEHGKVLRNVCWCNLVFYPCLLQHGAMQGTVHKQSTNIKVVLNRLATYGSTDFKVYGVDEDTKLGLDIAPAGCIVAVLGETLPFLHCCVCSVKSRELVCSATGKGSLQQVAVQVPCSLTPVVSRPAVEAPKVPANLSVAMLTDKVVAGSTVRADVFIRDAEGGPVDGIDPATIKILQTDTEFETCTFTLLSIEQESYGDGLYKVSAKAPTRVGSYPFCLTVAGRFVDTVTFSTCTSLDGPIIHVQHASPSLSNTSIHSDQTTIGEGGQLLSSVVVCDAYKNPITDAPMSLQHAEGSSVYTEVSLEQTPSSTIFCIKIKKAGRYCFGVLCDSVHVGTIRDIIVEADLTVSYANCSLAGPTSFNLLSPSGFRLGLTLRNACGLIIPTSLMPDLGSIHISGAMPGQADCKLTFVRVPDTNAARVMYFDWDKEAFLQTPSPILGTFTVCATKGQERLGQSLKISVEVQKDSLLSYQKHLGREVQEKGRIATDLYDASIAIRRENNEAVAQAKQLHAALTNADDTTKSCIKLALRTIQDVTLPRFEEKYIQISCTYREAETKWNIAKKLQIFWNGILRSLK